jgi:ACS family glucarate transporter-like MFS transporter
LRVRHSVFALIFCFGFSGYVQRTSVSIAAERMMPELGLTQVEIGWLFTAFLLAYSIFQIPGAVLGQRFGARHTLSAIGLATAGASVATALTPSIASGAALFVALFAARFLLGVAQAALFPVAAGTVRSWFPVAHWASRQGLTVTGLWLGAAVTPPLVAWLMAAYGWRWALGLVSLPALVLVVLWQIHARDRPAEHPAVSPQELAELAANPVTGSAASAASDAPQMSAKRLLRLLADPQILTLTASYFLMNYVFYLVTFWCFLYLVQERHLTVLESGWLASLPFVVAAIASATGGRIADRLRARHGERVGLRALPLAALPTSALFLYLTVALESAVWAIAALCLGFAMIELTEGSFWATAMRRAPDDAMAATAVLNTGGNLGGVVATPIIAALSARGGWTTVFATGAALAIVAALLWLRIDPNAPAPGVVDAEA